jgi:DNA polymerase zeta
MQSVFPADMFRVLQHLEDRANTVMDLVNESDLITKTSYVSREKYLPDDIYALCREFARVFGVDFMSVITRGSQLKVEAFMFRLAKQESFVLVSPSREDVSVFIHPSRRPGTLANQLPQVGLQNAAECIPMIMCALPSPSTSKTIHYSTFGLSLHPGNLVLPFTRVPSWYWTSRRSTLPS